MSKSPFPGMDPYLEGDMWPEFHDTLANQIRTQLMSLLPSKYVALLKRHYIIDHSGLNIVSMPPKRIIPDAQVVKVEEAAIKYDAVTAPAIELVSPLPEEFSVLNVEIRDVAERRLVTVIEILSPANKRGKGFEEYIEKRLALLQTSTHLLELDLLRAGKRIPLIGGELPAAPYYVFLSRFTRRPHTEIWPVQFREPLPTIPLPLLPPDPDVPLALQPAIDACFELVGYQRLLDYSSQPPSPPFGQEDLEWVRSMVEQYTDG